MNAEIYACALKDVYTFGPTFRAENSNTPRHLAEFWMVEPEMAFATLEDDMVRTHKSLNRGKVSEGFTFRGLLIGTCLG